MNWLLVCPIVIPLAAAVIGFAGRGSERTQRAVSLAGAVGLSAVAAGLLSTVWRDGIASVQIGRWPAPYGITLVADHLSAAMVAVSALIGLATVIYAFGDTRHGQLSKALHPLLHALLAGVCGAFLAGDIFNLYVWFEVMLIASLALLVLGGSPAQLDGAVRYAALSLIATTLLLSGIGLLYGLTGTLNMADLHLRVQEVEDQGLLTLVAMVFIVAFGLKSAVFPLFFWLPASYHTPQTAVSAVFSGLLTKVGVYALIRFFTLIFRHDVGYTHELLLWVAGLTMVTGVLGAASQSELRRILSFHIISQIGYNDPGPRALHDARVAGRHLLRYPPHHRESEPLLRFGRRQSTGRINRSSDARRALPRQTAARGAVLRAGVLAGGLPAAIRLLGEAPADPGLGRAR